MSDDDIVLRARMPSGDYLVTSFPASPVGGTLQGAPMMRLAAAPAAPRVIGFAGPIGAGKTTAAERLMAAHGFVRHRFAGPLKDMMRALGLGPAEVDGDRKEEPCALLCGRTPRWAMQTIGTEWGRDLIHPDLWTTIFAARVEASTMPVVADDVRFPNEVATIRRLGGIVVRVTRPGVAAAGHASELQPIDADVTIVNDGTLEALRAKVDRLV